MLNKIASQSTKVKHYEKKNFEMYINVRKILKCALVQGKGD